tara:strand:+ start:1466 stop:1864 length:399 start_codon:yes stop_codon:yes gene_type:complete
VKYGFAFVAGLIIPAIFAPFLMFFLVLQGEGQALASLPFLYFGPVLWGVWNVIFIKTRQVVPLPNRNVKCGFYGAVYGLLAALINSLLFDFTSVISGLSDIWIGAAIILYPLLLYVIWKYGVNVLNLVFDVY